MRTIAVIIFLVFSHQNYCQEPNITDLEFLIGTWEVEEHNEEKSWWEKSTRTGTYVLDSTYIQLDSKATSSSGKKRTYRWLIHYNKKDSQFEMVSMFSNWPKIQFDTLVYNAAERTLTVTGLEDAKDYHERFGVLKFNEDFTDYIWTGENKYGEKEKPNIWKYTETGKKIERRQKIMD